MDPILTTIDEALSRKGLSDAAASKLAVGHPSLLKNLRMPREGEKRYNLPALKRLADVLDLEFYFGPRRETGPFEQILIDGSDFAPVRHLDIRVSAGSGAINEDANVVETLAFRRDWLTKLGVSANSVVLVKVIGNSMQPGLHDGDLALVDTTKTTIRSGNVYALTDIDAQTLVKRIETVPDHGIILRSDNSDFAPLHRFGVDANSVAIHGQVIWSGHTWR
jgi:phage repressor protein C with HTH and peptisase S24 domain